LAKSQAFPSWEGFFMFCLKFVCYLLTLFRCYFTALQ